jgi:hypothetical protein
MPSAPGCATPVLQDASQEPTSYLYFHACKRYQLTKGACSCLPVCHSVSGWVRAGGLLHWLANARVEDIMNIQNCSLKISPYTLLLFALCLVHVCT